MQNRALGWWGKPPDIGGEPLSRRLTLFAHKGYARRLCFEAIVHFVMDKNLGSIIEPLIADIYCL
jgi:hypothetical protein